jgi:PAS domain S-box-containing protein
MNAETAASGTPVVLLVDDDAVVRFLAREALEEAGFVVAETDNGASALEMLAEIRPGVVMLDIVMPGMDGFATCTAIRATAIGAHIPVVMMTGLDDEESINRAFEAGATTFITKPLNLAILVHRLRYIVRTQGIEDELRESRARLAQAQRMARLGHWEWDPAMGMVHCSEGLSEMVGLGSGERQVPHAALLALIDEADRGRVAAALNATLKERTAHSIEYALTRPGGQRLVIVQEGSAIEGDGGKVARVVGIAQDITERRAAEDRIRNLANFDPVTGLPNRTFLIEILTQSLDAARRYGREAAILVLDIDHFKRINDSLGHGAGDGVLQTVAQRLVRCVRGSDRVFSGEDGRTGSGADLGAGNAVSRLGGDEFVVVLGEVRRAEDSAAAARRIAEALAAPIVVGTTEVRITASIGISVFPVDGTDVESLLKNADAAMFHAKEQGRDCSRFYTASLNERAVKRFSLETNLRKALERDEFIVYYQPKIDVANGRPSGMEALIRWRRADGAIVAPGEFIPIAEETGLIVPIGDWVLRKACAQAVAWIMRGFGPMKLSVNLSAAQFRQPRLVAGIAEIVAKTALAPEFLDLELTEGMLVEDTANSIAILNELKELGVGVAIDDFGTGYSSLSYLKRFRLDALKIDRSFVRDLVTDADDGAIVKATIALAHSLRLQVIAEGVEIQAQLDVLRDLGCDEAQGYLFSPPLPAQAFEDWLIERRRPAPLLATALS